MIDEILKSHKVLVCAGSGGVGKTTISAALAVRAAELGLSVLVLTIDPARRLATALGLETWTEEEILVPGQSFPGQLYAAMIEPKKTFDRFVRETAPSTAEAERIIHNPLYETLTTTLGGSQEFTSLERLYQATQSRRFDLVILDTPPAQHALEFLMAPQRFYSLFQESIVKWFLAPPSQQENFFASLVHRGTRAVFKALESLTGSEFMHQLHEFFTSIQSLQGPIREHSIAIHRLLTMPEAGFFVVTSFDEVKLDEAKSFHKTLVRGGYHLRSIVINRAFPEWLDHTALPSRLDSRQMSLLERLGQYYRTLESYFIRQRTAYNEFEKTISDDVVVVKIPDYMEDVHNLSTLAIVARELSQPRMGDRGSKQETISKESH